jgi:hypothetical protein
MEGADLGAVKAPDAEAVVGSKNEDVELLVIVEAALLDPESAVKLILLA